MNHKDIQLSKTLSWLLRHGATNEGLTLKPDGYIDVNQLLLHKNFKGKYNKTDIERVVNCNDKKRFNLRLNPHTNILEIRANQGHSVSEVTDAALTPLLESKYSTVVHGTYYKCWPQIKCHGLNRMKRQHIHFAKGTLGDSTVISGLRKDAQIYIYIDLKKALDDGIKYYESDNGVILTRGNKEGYLLPKYFSKVVDVLTGEQLHP